LTYNEHHTKLGAFRGIFAKLV
jgi:hypothetical protein